jgi:N-methylhydantoinase B
MNVAIVESLDPITVEVVRNKLEGIANEMQVKLIRSSFSPMVREGFDAAACLLTIQGEFLAQAVSVPGLMSALVPATAEICRRFPTGQMADGDVFVVNDPYLGGSHIPDVVMVMPVFFDGTLIAFSGSVAHHQDFGGMVPGSMPTDATEIFQEGLRLPPVKFLDRGVENATLVEIIRQNVRTPGAVLGDLQAQLAACRSGGERLRDLADEHGTRRLLRLFAALLDRSEALTRQVLRSIPDGTYRYATILDNDGVALDKPVRIQVAVTVEDGTVTIDLSGTDPQATGPINCVPTLTWASSYFALRAISGDDIPTNGGCFRPLRIHLPKGSLVNPNEPAPVNARTAVSKRIVAAILGAFRQAIPDRVPAESCHELLVLVLAGRRNDGRSYISGELLVGGSGATPRLDGVDVIDTDNSNCMNMPVEALEAEAPLRLHRFALRDGSGGAGRRRGGLGCIREYELLEGEATLTHRGERHFFAALGFAGGEDGACARSTIVRASGEIEEIRSKAVMRLKAGDRLVIETAGGAGYGPADEREPAAAARDLRDGKVLL